jgi:hypothetical protein
VIDLNSVAVIAQIATTETTLYGSDGAEKGTDANPMSISGALTYVPSVIPNATPVIGTITTLNGTVQATSEGWESCNVVLTGTWSAQIVPEVSCDGGNTWTMSAFVGSAAPSPNPALIYVATSNDVYQMIGNSASTHVRVRAYGFTSGSVSVRIVLSDTSQAAPLTRSLMHQDVVISSYNNSIINLNGGASFTGIGETSLGVSGIKINFISDQVCRVQVQQSMDNVTDHWDVVDQFTSEAGIGEGRTFQVIGSYFRVVVTNITNTTTTYLRLQAVLCPVVEAVPRTLSNRGNQKTSVEESVITTRYYVVNEQFYGNYLNEYNWYKLFINGGTVTPSATYVELSTTTDPASSADLRSKTRTTPSIEPKLVFQVSLTLDHPTGLTNNARRWGLMSGSTLETDGACFELKDEVLYATLLSNSTATRLNIDGFKDLTGKFCKYSVEVSRTEMVWSIDNAIVHRITDTCTLSQFYNRSLSCQISNTNSGTVSSSAYLRVAGITLYDNSTSASVVQGDEGTPAKVSIDGYLRYKGYGSVLFTERFPDNTLDTTNKWTETIVAGGNRSFSGTIISLDVTTASGASITETAKQSILSVANQSMNRIITVVNLGTVFDNNNRREWGSKTDNNGLFFRQVGTVTYAVALKLGVETVLVVPPMIDGRSHVYEIIRTGTTDVWFYIDRERIGAMHGTTISLLGSKYDTAYFANYNVGTTSSAVSLKSSGISIIEDTNQSLNLIGTDPFGLKRNVAVDQYGSLRITGVGANGPTTTEAGETLALRAYQTTCEYEMNSTSTEYPIILVRNPSGSGKKIFIKDIYFTCLNGSGKNAILRIYSSPTVTANGTTLTPHSMFIGGGAPTATTLVTTVPTVTANGTKISVAASTNEQATLTYNWGLVLAENNSLLLTGQGSGNNTVVTINIIWTGATV